MEKGIFNKKLTFILGFGFFSTSLLWAIYNAFVPIFLSNFLESKQQIGWLMTIDNMFAVVMLPLIGMVSDKTHTRFGRRMPYIMVGLPLAAVLFSIIPFHTGLIMLVATIILTNISMGTFGSPVIALMPDITPVEHRSRANGIINFMGGLGAVLAYGLGSILFRVDKRLPFFFVTVLMLFAFFMLVKFIKEPKDSKEASENDLEGLKLVKFSDVKKVLILLIAIFLWFISFNGVEAMFSLYGKEFLRIDPSEASFSITFFSIFFLIFAIPAGIIGGKLGKKRTILIGLSGLLCVFIALYFSRNIWIIRGFLSIGGLFWACININSYPLVVSQATPAKIGAFTGLYYLASQSSSIVSPPLLGFIIDKIGFSNLFLYSSIACALSLTFMIFVKDRSEVKTSS